MGTQLVGIIYRLEYLLRLAIAAPYAYMHQAGVAAPSSLAAANAAGAAGVECGEGETAAATATATATSTDVGGMVGKGNNGAALDNQQQQQQQQQQQRDASVLEGGGATGAADPGSLFTIMGLCFLVAIVCALDRVAMSVAIVPMGNVYDYSETTKGLVSTAAQQHSGLIRERCSVSLFVSVKTTHRPQSVPSTRPACRSDIDRHTPNTPPPPAHFPHSTLVLAHSARVTDKQRFLVGIHGLHGAVLRADRGVGPKADHHRGRARVVGGPDAVPDRGRRVPGDPARLQVPHGRRGGRDHAVDPGDRGAVGATGPEERVAVAHHQWPSGVVHVWCRSAGVRGTLSYVDPRHRVARAPAVFISPVQAQNTCSMLSLCVSVFSLLLGGIGMPVAP